MLFYLPMTTAPNQSLENPIMKLISELNVFRCCHGNIAKATAVISIECSRLILYRAFKNILLNEITLKDLLVLVHFRVTTTFKFNFLLKTDDDCFLDAVRILHRLESLKNATRTWLGR